MVLFTLILIFLYLLYVIKPIFESADVEPVNEISVQANGNILATGLDELKEVAYQLDSEGYMTFYQMSESDFRAQGSQILSEQLFAGGIAKVIAADNGRHLIIDNEGEVSLIAAKFTAIYPRDSRDITPSIIYPLGEEALPIDEQEQGITKLGFAMNDEKATFVAFTDDQRLIKTTLVADDDFNYDPEFEPVYQEIEFDGTKVDDIMVTPDLMMAFVRSGNQVTVYDMDDEFSVDVKAELTNIVAENVDITAMALLSGGSSVLFGDSQGQVSQWFEVAGKKGRQFQEIRRFSASETEAVAGIYTEMFRKSFYTMTASGEMGIFYTTSDADLWHGAIAKEMPKALAIAPRADALIAADGSSLALIALHNEHPEVTWKALWQEVWYEGYPEPDYIWQSTGGADDFESKFSLVPISFGTMKAAAYAMLFAVPLALSAAIYTAYFMPPALRKKVKPTIELMEALPTVILGFLAGLWLAPLIEDYLPAIVLLLIFLPVATFLTAFTWFKLPREYKAKLPEEWAPIILIPILILAGFLAFSLSPVMESLFFGGDIRQYITNDLGISFDQRNALVVGIAMGFAVVPTIFSMAEDAIFSVPKHLTSGSLALGATPWQTLVKVVLLTASPGIFSAIMMGLGRAVGETMIVLMATGNTPVLDWSIFQGMRTLSANIAVEMPESEVGSSHYRILFLAAFVLFVFTFVFNTLAEFVRQRLREKYSSL
ncbi:ABC transporter permease subunit [Thalassotalea euphylliae]|uniref:ABC transporter permease subunit n=1 Tax=Thalassotalea euphylliae TaxID=1655234 RepID=A0A3E0UH77_9GAMM|nr:ABC transporter permease subunit [Thalassotalea euphylliae]REL36401.1 ABC transporter permease subunit [Thalassotalea euphylliae]